MQLGMQLCSWAGSHAAGHAIMQLSRQSKQAIIHLGRQSCSGAVSHAAGHAVMQLGRLSCGVVFLLKVSLVETMRKAIVVKVRILTNY